MIARIWKGEIPTSKREDYMDVLEATGIRGFQATEGHRGAFILCRELDGEKSEVAVVSLWESMEAVRRFAGPESENAVYYPQDDAYLLTFEPHVDHYEIAHWSGEPGL